jgi:hypothetical protein
MLELTMAKPKEFVESVAVTPPDVREGFALRRALVVCGYAA